MGWANVASRALFCRSNRRGQAIDNRRVTRHGRVAGRGSQGLVATARLADPAVAANIMSIFPPQRCPSGAPEGSWGGGRSVVEGREDASQPRS